MATYLNEGDASRADGLNTASANSGDPPLPVAGAADRELTRQVEQQTRFFDTTLNAISDFAYFLNLDGRFQYANQALLDLLGITLGDRLVSLNDRRFRRMCFFRQCARLRGEAECQDAKKKRDEGGGSDLVHGACESY